jgi:hypothetical protein
MKKVMVEYEVYEFKELSEEEKEKAKATWYENEDYPMLKDNLNELLGELLEENKIKEMGETKLGYSLSYSQGDGLNFTGTFEWKKYLIKITHSWRYEFASSSDIILMDKESGEEISNEKVEKQFKDMYIGICNKLEKAGYAELDYRMDDKEFQEHCESNGYNFSKNGKMINL